VSVNEIEKRLVNDGHHRPEIYESFKILHDKGLIWKTESVKSNVRTRGRTKTYYCLTEDGVKAIIIEEPEPKLFWTTMVGFCTYYKQANSQKIEELYKYFLNHFLKYPEAVDLGAILDLLNTACEEWMTENFSQEASSIELILNSLATSPNLTLNELSATTKIEQKKVRGLLENYSLNSLRYSDAYYIDERDYERFLSQQFQHYILHNIVAVTYDIGQEKRYSLSLFGIILYLLILRRRTEFDSGNSFENLFTQLAQSYNDKLPLIFGKFSVLATELEGWAIYNFDIILVNEQKRAQIMDGSILSGGNKELLQNMRSLSLLGRSNLAQVYEAGLSAYMEDAATHYRVQATGVPELESILEDLEDTLLLSTPISSLPSLYEMMMNERAVALMNEAPVPDFSSRQTDILETIETQLSTEITFLYFLNLNVDFYYPLGFAVPGHFAIKWIEDFVKRNRDLAINDIKKGKLSFPKFPREKLYRVLDTDSELKNWFCSLIAAAVRYQREVLDTMKKAPFMAISN
jgi:DNA-binding PadR family transcriptional regulator